MSQPETLGKALEIPEKVFNRISDVSDEIEKIELASKKMQQQVERDFNALNNGSVNDFIEKLRESRTILSELGEKGMNFSIKGIAAAVTEAEKLISTISKASVTAQQASSPRSGNKPDDSNAKQLAEYKKLQNEMMRLIKLQDKWAEKFPGRPQSQILSRLIAETGDRLKELEREIPQATESLSQLFTVKKAMQFEDHQEKIVKNNEKIAKSAEKANKAQERAYYERMDARYSTPEGALGFNANARTYVEQVQAIRFLEAAYKSLGNTEEDVATKGKLAEALKKTRESVKEADVEMGRLKNTMGGLFNYADQLRRAFSLIFSVSQIRNYIMNIAKTRGEFEKTEASLTALLKSKDKANQLFGQITELAVKSPFSIKELTSYTKQLAAYQIEYDKLFDTTKRLSDVSAGLGVEVGRLVLAYGQVRAANFLRGTEVRQFTEAGFDILGELAKYYSELEGTMVTVGDVQERVTKRMVAFGDVEEVFKRVTNAGGLFYQMQEKMADTLAGQISNLRDSVDLMLNEIGKSNEGLMKGFVGLLRTFADSWEILATALEVGIPLFVGVKIQSALATKGILSFATATKAAGTALKTAFGPISWILLGIEALFVLGNKYSDTIKRQREETERFNKETAVFAKIARASREVAEAIQGVNETDEDFAKRVYERKLQSLEEFKKELLSIEFPENLLPSTGNVSEENIDQVTKELESNAKAWADWGDMIGTTLGKNAERLELWGILSDNVKTDSEDLSNAAAGWQKVLNQRLDNVANSLTIVRDELDGLDPKIFRDFMEGIKPKSDKESELDYLLRVRNALWSLKRSTLQSDIYSVIGDSIDAATKKLNGFNRALGEVNREAGLLLQDIADKYFEGSMEDLQESAQKNPLVFTARIEKELALNGISEIAAEAMKEKILLKVGIDFSAPFVSAFDDLATWKKEVIATMKDSIAPVDDEDLKNFSTYEEYTDSVRRSWKGAKEWLEQYNKDLKTQGSLYEKQNAATKKMKEAEIKQAEEAAKLQGFNLYINKEVNKQETEHSKKVKETISLIEKMGKEYKEALDYMGSTSATADIRKRYAELATDLANAIGLNSSFVADMTFDTNGIIAALNQVAQKAADTGADEAERAARNAIANLEGETIKIRVDATAENLGKDIENALNQVDLWDELSKLGLGANLTEELFGVKSISLSDVRDSLDRWKKMQTDVNGEIAEKYQKAYDDANKKITDLEYKELQTRLQNYSKYLKQAMSEAVNVKLKEAKALQEIDEMYYRGEISAPYADMMRQGVQTESAKDYDKAKWDEFQNSDMYIRLFEDLDSASTIALKRLKTRLEDLRTTLTNLSPDDLKAIADQISKVDQQIAQRNPFAALRDAMREVRELENKGLTEEYLEQQMSATEDRLEGLTKETELLGRIIGYRNAENVLAEIQVATEANRLDLLSKSDDQLAEMLSNLQGQADALRDALLRLRQQKKVYENLAKLVGEDMAKHFSEWQKQISELFKGANELMDAFGIPDDSITRILSSALENMISLGFATIQQIVNFKAMGIAANSALGIIGWIALALQAVATLLSAIFKIHDKRLENQIEKQLELVENLEKRYEDLEEAISNAYSAGTYEGLESEMQNNLRSQNAAIDRAIAAEEDKKKTDKDRIADWRDQRAENEKLIRELETRAIESYGGFGTSDNIKSAAENFVEAWVDAFKETGDGLSGLEEQMDEFLDNAVKKQLLMRLSEEFVTPILEEFDKMFTDASDGGRTMTPEEKAAWEDFYNKNAKLFDEKAKMYLEALGIQPDSETDKSDLSGLQRGIQGVTETTAEALEALLNSIRYFSADTNSLIRQLFDTFTSADVSVNPILYELQQQTQLIGAIYSLFGSTTKLTNMDGRAIKMVMVG